MINWALAAMLVVSVMIHAAVLWPFNTVTPTPAALVTAPQVVIARVTFKQTAPAPPLPKVTPAPKPVAKVIPVQAKPKPVKQTAKIKAKALPKPVPMVTTPEPEIVAIADPVPVMPPVTQSTLIAKVAAPPVSTSPNQLALEKQREHHLAELLTHIESHKFYPRAARRRGIEGQVTVSFLLLPDGSAQDIHTEGNNKLLRKAASQAVNKALPLPASLARIEKPMPVKYKMDFALR